MMTVQSIVKIGDDIFSIIAGDGIETAQTICRRATETLGGGVVIGVLRFDSPEFTALLTKGIIDYFEVRDAVSDIRHSLHGGLESLPPP